MPRGIACLDLAMPRSILLKSSESVSFAFWGQIVILKLWANSTYRETIETLVVGKASFV